jgi:hypothetical protein
MDTRTLLTWVQEEGHRLRAYSPEDAAQVWIQRIMEDPEYLQDYWLDALEEDRARDGKLSLNILKTLPTAHRCIQALGSKGDDQYKAVMASSFAFHTQNLGRDVYLCILKHLEDHMTTYAEEYYADCVALEYEDIEAIREDRRENYVR